MIVTFIKQFVSFILIFFITVGTVNAAYFDSLIFDIPADKKFISRAIVNDTTRTNLYTLSVHKIDKPGKNGENRIVSGDMEIIYAPLKFTVQPDGTEYFKLFYRGPEDSTERYYRVEFKESPILLFPLKSNDKNMDIIPVVSMSTVLVVRPRKMNLDFHIDESTGTIRNTGNTFFRVVIQKGCNGDDESSSQFYMLPGETYNNSLAKANNRKYIVALGRYYQLGEGCFTS